MTFTFKSLALAAALTLTGISPMNAQSANEPVILINPFVVSAGSEDDAIAMWMQARDFLATQPGYISTKLHRSLSSDATYTLINVAEWESMETFRAATTAMRQSASIPRIEGVNGDPQLYSVIAE
jgi:heme-degrading monooxygenase HmoA